MDSSGMNGREVSGYDVIRMPMDRSVKFPVRVEIQEDRIFCHYLEKDLMHAGGFHDLFVDITKVAIKESQFGKDSVLVSFRSRDGGRDAVVTFKRKDAADLYEALQDALTRYANE
jgi:hypothetical protein